MRVTLYLYFGGQCEEAFAFYAAHLGATPGALFRYAGSPLAGSVPPDWGDKVMHASLELGEQTLNGGDLPPGRFQEAGGFSLSLNPATAAEAERIFQALAQGGEVVTPLGKTFWSERFGMVKDRFGIPWMVNCEPAPG